MKKVRIPNPLVIFVVRKDIFLMCARARLRVNMINLETCVISKVIRHMNAKQGPCIHQDLKVTDTIVRNMDVEPLNVDPSPCGHQTSQKR